ncbi:MAG: PTS fructose transporter subunit IIA [Deltaproteobacteria bacterium HGW-Deltaproteobacteria-4]|nr:MAG: PTS fructose transporter subunit IIA [Deltaproteobacteria bacterium HGW-Deltaproteobacteria-4]
MNLSVKEAARLLSVSEKTIYRWIQKEVIPAYRIHEQYRFNRAELMEWATSRRIGAVPESLLTPSSPSSVPISLSDALEAGGIFYRISGSTRDQVLADIVTHLRLSDGIDRNKLLKLLIVRENLCSTGIGNGIALPHLRNPGILPISRATVTLCFLENKVDFQALDGLSVDTLFTIMAPDLPAHLNLYARLNFLLQRPALRRMLAIPGGREEIMTTLRAEEERLSE